MEENVWLLLFSSPFLCLFLHYRVINMATIVPYLNDYLKNAKALSHLPNHILLWNKIRFFLKNINFISLIKAFTWSILFCFIFIFLKSERPCKPRRLVKYFLFLCSML